jgi:hypothetical protein
MSDVDPVAFGELYRGFRGELLTEHDPEYDQARVVWNAMVDNIRP